jgi:hypothetical protein
MPTNVQLAASAFAPAPKKRSRCSASRVGNDRDPRVICSNCTKRAQSAFRPWERGHPARFLLRCVRFKRGQDARGPGGGPDAISVTLCTQSPLRVIPATTRAQSRHAIGKRV